eukprot:8717585-Alexandrium_andersonii.AAC.1
MLCILPASSRARWARRRWGQRPPPRAQGRKCLPEGAERLPGPGTRTGRGQCPRHRTTAPPTGLCWLLAAGCRPLAAAGYWLLATN